MHEILVEKPYKFTPPITWHWPQRLLTRFGQFQRLIRDEHGIIDHECRHVDRLRASVDAGHGIMLTPNHPRTTDPVPLPGWQSFLIFDMLQSLLPAFPVPDRRLCDRPCSDRHPVPDDA